MMKDDEWYFVGTIYSRLFFVTLSLCVYLFEASLVCRLFSAANGLLTDIKAFIIATAVALHVYTKFQGWR